MTIRKSPTLFARIGAYFAKAIDNADLSIACGNEAADHYGQPYTQVDEARDWLRGLAEGLGAPFRAQYRKWLRKKKFGAMNVVQLEHAIFMRAAIKRKLDDVLTYQEREQYPRSADALNKVMGGNSAEILLLLEEIAARRVRTGTNNWQDLNGRVREAVDAR